MPTRDLSADFPAPSYEDWLKRVEATLQGADFDERLVWRSHDAIAVAPLAVAGEGEPAGRPWSRGPGPWAIAQAHGEPAPDAANRAILEDLGNGVDAVVLKLAEAEGAAGIQAFDVDALDAVLKGVALERVPVHLDAGARGLAAARLLVALWKRHGVGPADRKGSFGVDAAGAEAAEAVALSSGSVRALTVDLRGRHLAGASEAQELAIALATGVGALRALEAEGVAAEDAAGQMRFVLVADADVFMTIAKLRAARGLWARVSEACGIEGAPMALGAETAARMLTRRDPWVNMLRATAACFAAGVGGADWVTVAPHTAASGVADGFARRIARNVQLILQEESGIGRVADAAGGAWHVEALTDALAETAWSLFQEIEAEGGIAAAERLGHVDAMVAEAAGRRGRDIARRTSRITGVSGFPDLDEPRPEHPSAIAGRLAEPFEELRDRSDRILERTGARPRVFLRTLGRPADFTARATWAHNMFAAGGIETVEGDDFRRSGTEIAVICSSDAVHARKAAPAARALKEAGARHVYLAGEPGALEAELRAAGVDTFLYEGVDVLAVLNSAYDILCL